MLVILLILFFTILLLVQLYNYLTPIREGIDDSTCEAIDFSQRISSLETKIKDFNIDEIETKLLDISNNVSELMDQSQAQYADLQTQGEDANNMTQDRPSDFDEDINLDEDTGGNVDEETNMNDLSPDVNEEEEDNQFGPTPNVF